ncbi:DNA polymerase III subunit alpha, partial [Paenibacillus sp. MCAF20]
LEKGGLVIMQATVQQQDDDFKLIVEDVVPLGRPELNLAYEVRKLQGQAARRAARPYGTAQTTTRSSAAPSVNNNATNENTAQGPAVEQHKAQPAGTAAVSASIPVKPAQERKKQRVYIKVTEANDQTGTLDKLKAVLTAHHGTLDTVLFYERDQKSRALSEAYSVKPSPKLFSEIEALLGEGAIVVR